MSGKVLFACSKCFSRHPFEELSVGQQLCKECRGTFPLVKCFYCRSEFQQTSKGTTSSVCKKCEQNVKVYGKPSACECCNIIAAFIGNKCQRCSTSELKYGSPVQCEQCKQRCAFDKHDENKKIDGKLLCWLCTLSYKRTMLKARRVEKDVRLTKKRPSGERSIKENSKRHSRTSDLTSKQQQQQQQQQQQSLNDIITEKNSRHHQASNNISGALGGMGIGAAAPPIIDPNSSDHVVAMTQLKEEIAGLQKRLNSKDKDLLEKDKMITELKGKNFSNENELRSKMKESERLYEMKVELLNKKVSTLMKQVAQLTKQKDGKKTNKNGRSNGSNTNVKELAKDSGSSSGTDSPNTN